MTPLLGINDLSCHSIFLGPIFWSTFALFLILELESSISSNIRGALGKSVFYYFLSLALEVLLVAPYHTREIRTFQLQIMYIKIRIFSCHSFHI